MFQMILIGNYIHTLACSRHSASGFGLGHFQLMQRVQMLLMFPTHQVPHGRPFGIVEERRRSFDGFQSGEVSLLTRLDALLLVPRDSVVFV
jgi:hypothetical protein